MRIVVGERGRVEFESELVLRFDYGAHRAVGDAAAGRHAARHRRARHGDLRTPVGTRGKDLTTVADFTVAAGETHPVCAVLCARHTSIRRRRSIRKSALGRDRELLEGLGRQAQISCPWNEAVCRSLITLKALTYAPTGGLCAAPTTSLPEFIGGERNWDYRFCWLRDATLTLLALMNAGYFEEALAWRDWLLRATMGSPSQIQIMYGLRGERRLTEWQVHWLAGYENSAPVRIGNAAHDQRQLDIFGEVMDALHQARKGGLPQIDAGWDLQQALLAHLEKIWVERDNGIWEVRCGREHFTFSKVMAWVAFDRAIRSAESFKLPGPVDHWRTIRDHIHNDICERGFDNEVVSFVRSYGSKELDASLLLLPALGFLPPEDPRIRATVEAIERELVVDGLVLRYDTQKSEDGLPAGEGFFLACSFWLVDAYLMLGRRDEAVALFERLLALRNDVGLLSEEYEPRSKRLVGNFPQAFSHLALVNSASNLAHYRKPAEQRSQHSVKGSP